MYKIDRMGGGVPNRSLGQTHGIYAIYLNASSWPNGTVFFVKSWLSRK